MIKGYFITGTDTDVGKTLVSASLLYLLRQQGLSVVGMKPIASGCRKTGQGLRNDDASLLIEHSSHQPEYNDVNPYAFEAAIAPHIAAAVNNTQIEIETIYQAFMRLSQSNDYCIVEGVGGWRVPVNQNKTMVDVARRIGLPVIVVVGIRLGCINHALLTIESINLSGLECAGWIANCIDPGAAEIGKVIDAIAERADKPLLGIIPHQSSLSVQDCASFINIESIISI